MNKKITHLQVLSLKFQISYVFVQTDHLDKFRLEGGVGGFHNLSSLTGQINAFH